MDERRASECVVVFHAHPDDEAIFTGGTIARLTDDGVRVVVVLATHGAHSSRSPLAEVRRREAERACELLGVQRVDFLGHADSGLDGDAAEEPGAAFCQQPVATAAAPLAALLRDEHADALVVYDAGGIYGHPDHIAVHRVGHAAALAAGVATVYESTVDREYLHFVATHLVGHAVQSLLGMEITATNVAPLGVPTVEVTTTVDVRGHSERKRAAMAAHASQIAADSETLTMDGETFDGVYGFEWYVDRKSVV